jgi:hypothetical protein
MSTLGATAGRQRPVESAPTTYLRSKDRHRNREAFRVRLSQAVATLRRGSRGKQLCLFLDAIDNAAEHAEDKGEVAFPRLLLESFHHSGPVAGVQLILSCRTHRRGISIGDIPCEEFELKHLAPQRRRSTFATAFRE